MTTSINKIIMLNCFDSLCDYLRYDQVYNPFTFYSPKFIIDHQTFIHRDAENPSHSIRIWKSNTLCNQWYNDLQTNSFVAALDYQIRKDDVKIEYMNVNDNECIYSEKPIRQSEAIYLHHELLNFIKRIAEVEQKSKVIIDVHENLRIYNKYYKDEGFQLTNRKAKDNPFWKEVEFIISTELDQ